MFHAEQKPTIIGEIDVLCCAPSSLTKRIDKLSLFFIKRLKRLEKERGRERERDSVHYQYKVKKGLYVFFV